MNKTFPLFEHLPQHRYLDEYTHSRRRRLGKVASDVALYSMAAMGLTTSAYLLHIAHEIHQAAHIDESPGEAHGNGSAETPGITSIDAPQADAPKAIETPPPESADRFAARQEIKARCETLPTDDEIASIEEKRALIADAPTPHEAAALLGLELPSREIGDAAKKSINEATDIEQTEEVMQQFMMKQFDISFDAELRFDNHLEDYLKPDYINVLNLLTHLPKDTFAEAGVNDLMIVDTADPNYRGKRVAGYYVSGVQSIFLDEVMPVSIQGPDKKNTLYHELVGHAVHEALCGKDFLNETAFASLNEPDFVYNPNILEDNPFHINDRPEEFASAYAQEKSYEDYAETVTVLVNDLELVSLSPETILDEKKLFALVRLERFFPGFGVYMDWLKTAPSDPLVY